MPLYAKTYAPLSDEPIEDDGLLDEFVKGFGAGVDQTQALGGGFLALAGSAFGNDDWFYDGLDYYNEQMAEAAENEGSVQRVEDIEGAGDLLAYTAYTAGNLLPSIAGAAVTGGVGAAGAKFVGDRLIKSKLKDMADELVKKNAKAALVKKIPQNYRDQVLAGVGRKGAVAGAVGFGAVLGGGENFMRQLEENGEEAPGIAFATGIVSGSLDALVPLKALKRILPEKAFAKARSDIGEKVLEQRSLMRRMATEGLKASGMEGLTEATQEFVQNVSVGWVKANLNPEDQDAFIDTVFGETAQSAYLNAFVAGAIGGGTVGSLTGIARDDISRPRTPGDNLTTDDLIPDDDSPLGLPRPDQVDGPRGNRRTRDRDTKESDTETERVRRAAGMPPERDNPEQIEPDLTVDVEGNVFEDTSPEAKRQRATDNARAELEGGAKRQPRGIFERRESLDLRIKVRAEQEQERLRVMIQARRDAQQAIRDAMEEGSQPPLPEGTERVQREFNADAEQEQQDRTREQAVGLNADIEADMGVIRDQPTFMRNRVREAAIEAGTAEDPLNITWIPKDPNDPNDMNRFTLRGKTYGYVGVETNDDGTTTGILATEANGDEAVIRTKIPRTKIERLRIEAEQSQAAMDGEVDTDVLPPIVQKKIKDKAEADGVPMPETVPVQVALDAAEDAQNETDADVLSNTDSVLKENVVFKPVPDWDTIPPEVTADNPMLDSTPPFNGLVSKFQAGKETFDPDRYNKEYAGRSVKFEGEETPIVLPEFTEADARNLQNQLEGKPERLKGGAPGKKRNTYKITPFVEYSDPQNTVNSQRVKIAIQDLIASGMPKQAFSMTSALQIFSGSAAPAMYSAQLNRVMLHQDLFKSDSVKNKKLLRFSLAHEYSHAMDETIGFTNTDPKFDATLSSFNSETKEASLDVGEIIGELYQQYTANNPVGKVMLYPFYFMQKRIQAGPQRTTEALNFLKREVFAQSFALFIADPKALKQYAPKTFAYMQKLRRDERITNYGQDSNQADIAQPDNRRVREGVRTPPESGSPTGDDAGGDRPASGSGAVQGETGTGVGGTPNDQVRVNGGQAVRGRESATVTPFYGRDNTFSVAMPDGTEYTFRRDDDGSIVNEETGDVFTGEPGRASILDIDGTMVRIPGSGPANIEEMVVSTRFPTAVKATEDPVTDVLVNDYAGYTANESVFSKNMALVKKYNNLTKKQQRLSDKSAAETLIDHIKSNLLSIFDAVPESTREISKQWYKGANKIVQRMADRHGVSLAQASAVAANLSPQKDWYQNASLAERVLDIFHSQKSSAFDGQMQDKAEEIYFHKDVSDKAKVSNREMLDLIGDKSLQNLIDEGAETDVIGMWIRTWDQTYNDPAYRLVSPDGKFLEYAVNADGETKSRVAWGSLNEIGKSVSVLLDSSQENISRSLGSKNKVRNFYNNIFEPDSQSGFVTIDTHAVAAGLLKPLAGDSLEVSHNFGTGKGTSSSSITGHSGTYSIFEEAYRQAAKERGVLAREMQSITWEAVRGLFTPTYKAQSQNVLFVEGVWNQYSKGKLSLDEARNKINEHSGGIQRPDWERSDFTVPDEVSETSYQRKLPDNSVSGPPLGPQETAGRGAGVDATGVSPAQGLDRRPEQTRDPVLQKAVQDRMDRNITAGELRAIFEERGRPIAEMSPDQIPELISDDKATNALSKTNAEKPPKPRKETYWDAPLVDGERYGARLDIPSYTRVPVDERADIVTVHTAKPEGSNKSSAGKRLSYRRSIRLTNVTFAVPTKGAMKIALGADKNTIATIEGTYVERSDEQNRSDFIAKMSDPAWKQVSMNPERSSEFYDMQGNPVLGASEVIQLGNLVLAKDADSVDRDPNSDTFGEVLTVDDIEFSMAPEIQAVADKVLSRPSEDVTVKEKASRYVKDVKTNPQGYLASKWQGFVQGVFDDVNRVGYNEKQLTQDGKLKDGAESAYKAALWTKNLETTMQAVMFGGPLELRDGAFQMVEGEGSFYDIFEGYDRNQLKEWELWAAANRAKRLKTEDRENLFSQKDIDTVLRAAERNGTAAQYRETLAKWTKFNRKILDLAEQSGVLDPQKRAAWDRDDYVPFFRFDDEADTNDLQNDAVNIKNGLMNQGLNIKRLEGGEGKINPLESMVSQLTTMIDRSFKNEAMRRIARDNAELGTMVEVTASDANIELASNPDKSELIKVYDGGKARVFQVKDPMLLRSIGGLGGYKLDKMAQAFAIPKQVLTRSVTIDPGFMIANAFRDMLASSIQFPNAPNPLLNIAKAMKYIGGGLANEATGAEIDSFSESKQSLMKIMASGGLAIGDFYGTGQSDNIRSDLGRINSMDSTLNTPDKIEAFYKDNLDFAAGTVKNLWNKWNRVGQTFEQASRINVFEGALANGETHAEAVSQAADVLNFSMRGDFWLIKHIVNSYPFMNARLQGLNVLGRSLRDNTQHVLTRGGSVAAATVALYMINQDNEEYEDLPDYDKDLYWHFFVGGEHFRLPKPFEIGTAFATYPERLVQYSMEEDKGHEFLWEKFKDGVVTALSFDAFPQVVKPLVDVISNKDSFRDMKIVSGALENAPPEQQFDIFTSDTSKSIAQSMPEGAPDYLRSPMMVDYLLRGYFASWSSFGAMILDPYTRDPSLPDRPEKLVSQYPVVKRFFRSDMTTSKYADLFYEVRGELDNMNREFNSLLENGRTREARDYLNEMGGFDEARKDIRGYYKQIRAINKQRDLIYMDSKLSASRKQQLISKLYERRNTLFKEAYLKHSQFYPEYGDR
jgi:hypothetical protein